MEWKGSSPHLQKALLAASMTRWAQSKNSPDILIAGRRIYGESLVLLRRALTDSTACLQDDVLASTCVLVLYELFDPTEDRLDAWLGHLSGVYRVLQHRGPSRHVSIGAKAILEHARYILMFQHLASRKTSFLSEREWISAPWQDSSKSVEQMVFDNGLLLADIFERCDKITSTSSGMLHAEALLHDCVTIFEDTETLLREHIRSAIGYDLENSPGHDGESLGVRNPAALLLSITAEAIKLGACDSAKRILFQAGPQCLAKGDIRTNVEMMVKASFPLAVRILEDISSCKTLRIGGMGAGRMAFALRLALSQFQPGSFEYAKCQRLIGKLKGEGDRSGGIDKVGPQLSDKYAARLVQGNAEAIATRWERYADSAGSNAQSNTCGGLSQLDFYLHVESKASRNTMESAGLPHRAQDQP